MPTFQSIGELLRGLQKAPALLQDMLVKRRSVSIRYDYALDSLNGDENTLEYLIGFGVIVRDGDMLEIGEAYQRFFEDVLFLNEEINIASVQTYIDSLKLKIESYLSAENSRKAQFLRDIRRTLRSIDTTTYRNVVDLKRNIDNTYKQEPNFSIKQLRLKDFDKKSEVIESLILETENLMKRQTIFFSSASDYVMKQTVDEVKDGLHDSMHGLIEARRQIIDYLNKIEYQNQLVKKIRQLKYLRDQLYIEDATNVKKVLAEHNDVWMEPYPKYSTKVSLDFLRNEDVALDILNDIRQRLQRKVIKESKRAGKIDKEFLESGQEKGLVLSHQELINGFLAQSNNLFSYVWNYSFVTPIDGEEKLVLFLQLASHYYEELRFSNETATIENIEYPLIYPK